MLRWKRCFRLAALVALLGASAGVSAHHSVTGQFDASKHATLKGTITKIEWINPHTYIHIDVPDEKGVVTSWRFESLPTAMLRKAGLSPDLLMNGDGKVTATVLLARDGTQHLGYLLKLSYEDGHFYQLAAEGTTDANSDRAR
jgi:hypothetical protein